MSDLDPDGGGMLIVPMGTGIPGRLKKLVLQSLPSPLATLLPWWIEPSRQARPTSEVSINPVGQIRAQWSPKEPPELPVYRLGKERLGEV
jgi:hypothetical protein